MGGSCPLLEGATAKVPTSEHFKRITVVVNILYFSGGSDRTLAVHREQGLRR